MQVLYTTEQLHFFYGRLKSDSTVAKELMLDDGEDIESEWFNIDDILKISMIWKHYSQYCVFHNWKDNKFKGLLKILKGRSFYTMEKY